jgi:uncharacterized repeat protein (TIGR01451 family)
MNTRPSGLHLFRWLLLSLFCVTCVARGAIVGGAIQFSIDTYSAPESQSNVVLTVSRAGDTSVIASVSWSVAGGSATPGLDFSPSSGVISFAPGEFSRPLTLSIVDDAQVESNETVSISLSGPVNAQIAFPSNAVLTIFDNDFSSNQPPVAVIDAATVASGQSTFINVLTNDYDPDLTAIFIFGFTQPLHGTVSQSGGLYYQSVGGYAGPDSFQYTITDGNGGYATASVSLMVTNAVGPPAGADVSLTKYSSSSNTVEVGQQIIYTLAAFNSGPDIASNAVVIDTLPAGVSFVGASGGACTYDTNLHRVDCNVGFLGSGGQATVYVTVQVTGTGTLLNTATAQHGTFDPNLANNTSSVANTGVPAQADLSVTKYTSTTNALNIGSQIIYTLGAFNGGPSSAANVVIRDTLPPGVTLVSVTGTANSYSYDTNLNRVDVNFGTLAVAAAPTVYLTVNVTALAGSLVNCANIFSDAADPNAANNTACVTNTTSLPSADLRVTKTASTNSVAVGSDVIFNLSLRNLGPSTISNQVVVNDAIPPGYDYVGDNSAGSGSYYSWGLGQWVFPTGIVAGATQTVAITLRANTPGIFTNVATAAVPDGFSDPNLNNNSASVVVTNTLPSADLRITKTASAGTVAVSNSVVFNLTLVNNGPATVTNQLIVSEVIPPGYDYVGDNGAGTGNYYSWGLGQWVFPTGIVANATQTLTVTLIANAPGVYTNRAIIIVPDGYSDPNTNNNTSSAVVTNTQPQSDLRITKTASTNRALIGDYVVFTLTLSNSGPDSLTNAFHVEDLLPSGYQYWSNSASAGTAYSLGQGRWLIFNGLAAGASVTTSISTIANTNGVFTNTATIVPPPGILDPNTNNNSASVIVTNVLPHAELSLVKFLTSSNVNAGLGDRVSFTLLVSNAGPQTATNVLVRDFPDAGLVPVFAAAGTNGSFHPASNAFILTSLAVSQAVALEIRADVTGIGLLTNRASVYVPDGFVDTNLTNNASSAYVNAGLSTDLQLAKSASTNRVSTGQSIVFTIRLRNGGPTIASNTVVREVMPPGPVLLTSNVPPDTAFNPVTREWTLPRLTNGEWRDLLLTFRSLAEITVTNTAYVFSSPLPDPTSNDRTNSVAVTWVPSDYANLGISLTVRSNQLTVGFTNRIQFTVTNLGLRAASNITVLAPLPAGVVYVTNASTGNEWAYNPTNGIWTRSNALPASTASAFTLDVRATNAGLKVFTADITASQPFDPVLANNSASISYVSGTAVNIAGVVKCATNGPALAGATVTCSISGGPTQQVVTGPAGTFSFPNLPPGTYTITPATNGFSFQPASQTVTIATGTTNLPAFLAVPRNISGFVLTGPNGQGVPVVTVQLTGAATASTLTDSNGGFAFTNLGAGSYTVRPLTNGFPFARFSPTNAGFALGNPTNWANTVTFLLTNPVVVLRAMEFVQVIQNWQNGVPLVSNKATTVRTHLQLFGTNRAPMLVEGARLRLQRGAEQTNLPALNVDGSLMVRTNDSHQVRTNFDDSLNFRLPIEWARGTVTASLVWSNGNVFPIEPAEAGGTASNNEVIVFFRQMPAFPIHWVYLSWTNREFIGAPGGPTRVVTYRPPANMPQILGDRFLALYPIDRLTTNHTQARWPRTWGAPYPWAGEDEVTDQGENFLFQLMARLRADSRPPAAGGPIWYGMVPSVFVRGAADIGGYYAFGSDAIPAQYNLVGHEIGHAMGREHATHPDFGYVTNVWGPVAARRTNVMRLGRCTEQSNTNAPVFPMGVSRGQLAPVLGPWTPPEEMIFGYDHLVGRLINPSNTFDIMSYCNNGYGGSLPYSTSFPWMSFYSYTNIMNSIINRWGGGGAPGHAFGPFVPGDYLMVSGTLNEDLGTVAMSPLYTIPFDQPPAMPEPGPYVVRLIGPGNAILDEVTFTPTFDRSEFHLGEDNPSLFFQGHFNVPVRMPPDLVRVEIWYVAQLIAFRDATAHSPQVQVLSPLPGQQLGNGLFDVTWAASDLDGDPLSFLVQYSPDNGVTWETIAVDVTGNSLTVDADLLPSTTQGRFRVIVSDNFASSRDEIDGPVAVVNHAPSINLTRPSLQQTFSGEQMILFEASAYDIDQGPLGDNIQWFSSRDGFLGLGSTLLRESMSLSEGQHVVTAAITDLGGLSAATNVAIQVVRGTLPVLHIVQNGPDVTLSWQAALAQSGYQLQVTPTLTAPAWSSVTNAPQPLGDEVEVTLPSNASQRFFRLTRP